MSLTTETITETSDDDALVKKFNCVKCSIPLQDIKLLKKHFWKVHISKNEIVQHLSDRANQNKALKRHSLPENTSFKGVSNPRKRKLTADSHEPRKSKKKSTNLSDVSLPANSSKYESSDESSDAEESAEPSEYDKTMEKLNSIEPKDIAAFSLADDIDEEKLIQKYRLKYGSKVCNKSKEFKIEQIVWASWRNKGETIMWPAKISNLVKNKSGNIITRVYIRYFELNESKYSFKQDPSKVELFFRNVDSHLKYKEAAFRNERVRYEFMMTYTNALREFVESNEKDEAPEVNTEDKENVQMEQIPADINGSEKKSKPISNQFLVSGKWLSRNQVIEIANAPPSDEQLKIAEERAEYSKRLNDLFETDKFKEFMVGILTNTIECKRHQKYIKADISLRKEMRFSSPGPLIDEHQKKLAKQLEELQLAHYPNKPAYLKHYEYDVLYPEAVIWAIQKLEDLTYKKAELSYKKGFKRTLEEQTKQRCHELLNKCISTGDETPLETGANDRSTESNTTIEESLPSLIGSSDQSIEEPAENKVESQSEKAEEEPTPQAVEPVANEDMEVDPVVDTKDQQEEITEKTESEKPEEAEKSEEAKEPLSEPKTDEIVSTTADTVVEN